MYGARAAHPDMVCSGVRDPHALDPAFEAGSRFVLIIVRHRSSPAKTGLKQSLALDLVDKFA